VVTVLLGTAGALPDGLAVIFNLVLLEPKTLDAWKLTRLPETADVGVPERTPLELNVIPEGNAPLDTDQLIGAVPDAIN